MNLAETSHPNYQSYLLRVWRDDTRSIWHASLQSTATKQILHFADVQSLLQFLAMQQQPSNTASSNEA